MVNKTHIVILIGITFQKRIKRARALSGILDKFGIDVEDPVFVVVSLNCPNPLYLDTGKTVLDIGPFQSHVTELLTRAVRKLAGSMDDVRVGPNRITQKGETLRVLEAAIKETSSDGGFRFKQRQLWYVVRRMIGSRYPKYEYFTNAILPEARRKGVPGLEDLLKEANSEMHTPRSKVPLVLSTEEEERYVIPEYSYNKVLYIEKRGFKDVITSNGFHDRFDIAVIGSQGESSEASRRLLSRIEDEAKRRGEKIALMCVHDADREGFDIFYTLRGRSDGRWLELVDIGLSLTEARDLGYEFEDVVLEDAASLNAKLVENLPDQELFFLTGKDRESLRTEKIKRYKRVELNAMTPGVFLGWLEGKLRGLGVEGKVRPPDGVVVDSGKRAVREKVESIVREEFERAVDAKEIVEVSVERTLKDHDDVPDCTSRLDEALKKYPSEGWRELVRGFGEKQAVSLAGDTVKEMVADEISKRQRLNHT